MYSRLHFLVLIASFFMLVLLLELIRRGKLREEYSLVWFFSSAVIFLLMIFRGSLNFLAELVGIEYAPSFIFMAAIGLLMLIQIFHSMAISRLTSQVRDLAQNAAILRLIQNQVGRQLVEAQPLETEPFLNGNLVHLYSELERSVTPGELMRRALSLSLQALRATSGSVILLDLQETPREAILLYQGEVMSAPAAKIGDTLERGLAGWVLKNRKAALIVSTMDDALWVRRPWEEAD